jgi:hypothetical protein
MNPVTKVLAVMLVLLLIGVGGFLIHINGARIVGPLVKTPEGVEMCIVQQCNWGGEPFSTRFVFRKPGGSWGAFYLGHQDWYWGSSRAVLDTNAHVATFQNGTNLLLTFDWVNEIYWRPRRGSETGAQFQLPAGWSPGGSRGW